MYMLLSEDLKGMPILELETKSSSRADNKEQRLARSTFFYAPPSTATSENP